MSVNNAVISIEQIKGWLAIEEAPFFFFTTRGGQSVFLEFGRDGIQTVRESCYLIHRGESPAPDYFNSGRLPEADTTLDLGGGWLISSLALPAGADATTIRMKFKQRLSEMEKLLASQPTAA